MVALVSYSEVSTAALELADREQVMDRFFPERLLGEIFWDDAPSSATNNQSGPVQHSQLVIKAEPSPPANHSAFIQYRDLAEESSPNASHSHSMSMRMIAFLRKNWPVERNNKAAELERERCFRHMISERMRRQRQRQCCLALHSMLPHGTKTDNNSVIQMAAKEIQRLQACREELLSKNCLLEAAAIESSQVGGSKLQYLRVPYPKSGTDSMVEALKCLKAHCVDTRSIKSNFSQEELFAVLETETTSKIEDAEVERAIQRTLDEVEWKLHSQVKDGFKRQRLD